MSSAAVARLLLASSRFATRPTNATAVDWVIAVTALIASLVLASRHVSSFRPGPNALDWASGALIAASTLPLVVWRRSPGAVFALTTSLSVLLAVFGYSIGVLVGPTVALFLWAASRDTMHPWSRRNTELVIGLFVAYLGASALGDHGLPSVELVHTGLAFSVAWFAGERVRLGREHIADLEDRARRINRDIEREQQLALAEERARIARDLHDSVGHAINVIVVRAGAARIRSNTDSERAHAALEAIEEVARQTANEIDEIVGALRDPDREPGDEPTPLGLASVPTLVAHHIASGLDVNVTTAGPSRASDPAIDLAAYRILQEALTNAARHGTGRADVNVAITDAAVDITITNPIRDTNRAPSNNGGHGLIGMRERATLLGGTVHVERTLRTFTLHVHLPCRTQHR